MGEEVDPEKTGAWTPTGKALTPRESLGCCLLRVGWEKKGAEQREAAHFKE